MNRRGRKKLIGLNALNEIIRLKGLGVPLTKIHTRLTLDSHWSLTATRIIVMADEAGLTSVTRPSWLKAEPLIQDAPPSIVYEGVFPNGHWTS